MPAKSTVKSTKPKSASKSKVSGKSAIGKILKQFCYAALEDLSATVTDAFNDPYKGALATFLDYSNYLTPDPESGLKQAFALPDTAKQLIELLLGVLVEDIADLKLNSNDRPDKLGELIEENSSDVDSSFLNFLFKMNTPQFGSLLMTATDSDTFVMSMIRQKCGGIHNDTHQWLESKFINFMKCTAYNFAALWWFATSRSYDVSTVCSILLGMEMKFDVLQRAHQKIVYPVKKESTKKKNENATAEPETANVTTEEVSSALE